MMRKNIEAREVLVVKSKLHHFSKTVKIAKSELSDCLASTLENTDAS
jgi:hypothetical protein